jgi:hypothetical protein
LIWYTRGTDSSAASASFSTGMPDCSPGGSVGVAQRRLLRARPADVRAAWPDRYGLPSRPMSRRPQTHVNSRPSSLFTTEPKQPGIRRTVRSTSFKQRSRHVRDRSRLDQASGAASRSSRRSRRVARTRSANTARPSKQRSPKRRSSSLHYACTTSAGCSSISAMA